MDEQEDELNLGILCKLRQHMETFIFKNKNKAIMGPGKIDQQLRALSTFSEDLDTISRIHIEANNYV